MASEYIVVDKIKWWVSTGTKGTRFVQPLCPQHHLRLKERPDMGTPDAYGRRSRRPDYTATKLECAEGPHEFVLPRQFNDEQEYIRDRLDALVFSKQSYIYLDDMAIPVADETVKDKNSPVWVKTKVTDSKSGLRLLVWAGVRGDKSKTQLFIEPELRRMSFDQNDDHPTKVFAKVEATFANGVTSKIVKKS